MHPALAAPALCLLRSSNAGCQRARKLAVCNADSARSPANLMTFAEFKKKWSRYQGKEMSAIHRQRELP
jgi:hypothetical protein